MKIVCFDVDGTLININPNIWAILNKKYNFQEQDNLLYNQYKEGVITYQQWVNSDFEHYIKSGLNRIIMEIIFKKYNPFSGVRETLEILRKTSNLNIVSGSIDFLLKVHNLDGYFNNIFINKVSFDEDNIKNVEATPYDLDKKVEGLKLLTKRNVENVFYVGDGDNEIPLSKFMKEKGGNFIAFNSKSEELKDNAKYVIHSEDMKDILYLI